MQKALKPLDYLRFVYESFSKGYHVYLYTEKGGPSISNFFIPLYVEKSVYYIDSWTYLVSYLKTLGETQVKIDIEQLLNSIQSKYGAYLHKEIFFEYTKISSKEKKEIYEESLGNDPEILDWDYAKTLAHDVEALKKYCSKFGLETDKTTFDTAYKSLKMKSVHAEKAKEKDEQTKQEAERKVENS